jgi:hypothetical protein
VPQRGSDILERPVDLIASDHERRGNADFIACPWAKMPLSSGCSSTASMAKVEIERAFRAAIYESSRCGTHVFRVCVTGRPFAFYLTQPPPFARIYDRPALIRRAAGAVMKIGELANEVVQNPIPDERRSRILDAMFGEKSPCGPVIRPENLLVGPELAKKMPAREKSERLPCLVVGVSRKNNEQQQATDFARWFTGHSSPPDNFVKALSNSSNSLRIAISKPRHPPARRNLKPRIIAVQKAAKEVLRYVHKLAPPHKAQGGQDRKWHTAIKELGCLPNNPEVLYGLHAGASFLFRCKDSEFIVCLKIADTARNNPSKDLSAEVAACEDRFIADLELIVNLAEAYKNFEKKRPQNRMTAIPSGAATHRWEEQRLREARTWSPELFCAGIILAAIDWRDQPFIWPCEKWEACEDFWIANGGPPHNGSNDDACELWSKYLNAAKRTVGGVWRPVERHFGHVRFRSFDEPIPIPKSLRDDCVHRKGFKKTRKSNRVDLATLEEAKKFIDKLPETQREKKAWQDAKVAVDHASIGAKSTRFARGRLERAFNEPDDPTSPWYDPALSNESVHPEWVTTVKNQLLEYASAGGSDTVNELARRFNVRPTLAKQLLHELAEERRWLSRNNQVSP